MQWFSETICESSIIRRLKVNIISTYEYVFFPDSYMHDLLKNYLLKTYCVPGNVKYKKVNPR